MAGKTAWIVTTSVLLIGLPLLYAYDREKSLVEYERSSKDLLHLLHLNKTGLNYSEYMKSLI